MASKAEQRLIERKEAKQKKALFVLVPIFLGLIAWQGPGMFRAFTGGSEPEASSAPPAATVAPPPPGGAAPTTPPAAVAPPAAAPPAVQPPAAAEPGLPDTDVPPEAAEGQLLTFNRFVGKDPFKQQLLDGPTGAGAPSSGAPAPPPPPTGGTASIAPPPPPPPPATGSSSGSGTTARATSARIEVNGAAETVRARANFPAGDPVFRLASIEGSTVRIGLVAGSFDGGAKTVAAQVGETVVLVSRPDGLRYRIKLLAVGA